MKKLYRSRRDRILLGVCGGIARYFGIDPVIVRVLFIILLVFEPRFIVSYFIFALIIPGESKEHGQNNPDGNNRKVLAYGLIVIGAFLLVKNVIMLLGGDFIVGSVLIIIGLLVLLNR